MLRISRPLVVLSLALAASLPGTVLEAGAARPAKPRPGVVDTVRKVLIAFGMRHGWTIDPNGSPQEEDSPCLSGAGDLSSCKENDPLNRQNLGAPSFNR